MRGHQRVGQRPRRHQHQHRRHSRHHSAFRRRHAERHDGDQFGSHFRARVGGGGNGIIADTLTLTNNASGTITADALRHQANTATIYNYGTISAPTPGFGGTAVNVNSLTLINYASGVITGEGGGISGSSTPVASPISAPFPAGLIASALNGNAVFLTNFGTVSGRRRLGDLDGHGTIVNNVGGSITGISTPSRRFDQHHHIQCRHDHRERAALRSSSRPAAAATR